MQNAFKLFGVKDTESFDVYFKQSRVLLTTAYVLIVALILLFSGSITRFLFSQRIDARFEQFQHTVQEHPDHIPPPPNARDVRHDLVNTVVNVNLTLLLIVGILSYWFAGKTLRPVQNAYNKQRRFLSDASHELRTPLAILQTNLENERDAASTPEARASVDNHLEEVHRMHNLVQDLLILSQLHRDTLPTTAPELVNLPEAITNTIARLSPIAIQQHVLLTNSEITIEPIFIQSPRKELITHALTNVIQNAITYNKDGGAVDIALRVEGETAQIIVKDTGIGISPEELKQVFNRFYRSDKSRSRHTGGSGLGLAIVQSIVESLNGSINIQSEPGIGTNVTISLPIHKAS